MERVLGIGGVFVRAKDPERLRAWYADHLGIDLQPFGGAVFQGTPAGVTVWYLTTLDDAYFGRAEQPVMVNFRVADLDAMLAQLREGGVPVDDRVEESEQGRF